MNASIFSEPTVRRPAVKWEDDLYTLTPVQDEGGTWYKREDYFAPLGYGGINGAKLRQLIGLLAPQVEAQGVLTGCSVLSPQASMTALVGLHYGLPVTIVLGATTARTATRHENIAIADAAGASFYYAPVAYNPALQRTVDDLAKEPEYRGYYKLAYAITAPPEASDDEVVAFHELGANQVRNLPPGARTLVMAAGSCNSSVSVLYGLARARPAKLERVVLVAVGPSREAWMADRFEAIRRATGIDTAAYLDELQVERHDLHGSGFASYSDRMPWREAGINFHPTYEGKMMRYLRTVMPPGYVGADALFWIVGSEPRRAAMLDAFMLDGIPIKGKIKL